MDLKSILEGCKINDSGCQNILYKEFYGYVLKIAFRYLNQYDFARDVTNDSFVKAFRNISSLRYEHLENPRWLWMGWLKRIVIHTALDEIRKNKSKLKTIEFPEYPVAEMITTASADQIILYKELISQINELPDRYRFVLNLSLIDGYSHTEIARTLGIQAGTSQSLLSRGRSLLRNKILQKHSHVFSGTEYAF